MFIYYILGINTVAVWILRFYIWSQGIANVLVRFSCTMRVYCALFGNMTKNKMRASWWLLPLFSLLTFPACLNSLKVLLKLLFQWGQMSCYLSMKVCRTRLTVCRITVERFGDKEEYLFSQMVVFWSKMFRLWLTKWKQILKFFHKSAFLQRLDKKEAFHKRFTTLNNQYMLQKWTK